MNGDFCGLPVPDLPHQNYVRVLTNNMPQTPGKGESNVWFYLDLDDARKTVFHRIFDGNDLFVH